MKKLAGQPIAAAFVAQVVPALDGARLPGLPRKLHSTVREERVVCDLVLFFLSQHDVDRIVQHDIGDARRGLCHEHPRLWFAPRQKGSEPI